jgi:hypothetical protein
MKKIIFVMAVLIVFSSFVFAADCEDVIAKTIPCNEGSKWVCVDDDWVCVNKDDTSTWAAGPSKCRIQIEDIEIENLGLKLVTDDESRERIAIAIYEDDNGEIGNEIFSETEMELVLPIRDEWGDWGYVDSYDGIPHYYGYHKVDVGKTLDAGYYWIGVKKTQEPVNSVSVGVYDDGNPETYSNNKDKELDCWYEFNMPNVICPDYINLALGNRYYRIGDEFSFKVEILANLIAVPNYEFNIEIIGPDGFVDNGIVSTDDDGKYTIEGTMDTLKPGEYTIKVYSQSEYCFTYLEDSETFTIEGQISQCGDGFCSEQEALMMCTASARVCPVCEIPECPPGALCDYVVNCPPCDYEPYCEIGCAQDCLPSCGNGICESMTCEAIGCALSETVDNCPSDCGENIGTQMKISLSDNVLQSGQEQKIRISVESKSPENFEFDVFVSRSGIENILNMDKLECSYPEYGDAVCFYEGVFSDTDEYGRYVVNIIPQEPVPIRGDTVFIVEGKGIVNDYLITTNEIGKYTYMGYDIDHFEGKTMYVGNYLSKHDEVKVAVVDFGTRSDVQRFVQERLEEYPSITKITIDGYPVYLYEESGQKIFFWSRKNFMIMVIDDAAATTSSYTGSMEGTTVAEGSYDTVDIRTMPSISVEQANSLTPKEIVNIIEQQKTSLISGHVVAATEQAFENAVYPMTEYPMDIITAYLEKYPSDNGAIGTECEEYGGICISEIGNYVPKGFEINTYSCGSEGLKTRNFCYIKKIDSSDFITMALQLEEMRIELLQFQQQSEKIMEFYLGSGMQNDVERYEHIKQLFNNAIDSIDRTKLLVRDNLDNPAVAKADVKEGLIYVREVIKEIVRTMLSASVEPVDDVDEEPVDDVCVYQQMDLPCQPGSHWECSEDGWTCEDDEPVSQTKTIEMEVTEWGWYESETTSFPMIIEEGKDFGYAVANHEELGETQFKLVKIMDLDTIKIEVIDELALEGESISDPIVNPIIITNEKTCFNTRTLDAGTTYCINVKQLVDRDAVRCEADYGVGATNIGQFSDVESEMTLNLCVDIFESEKSKIDENVCSNAYLSGIDTPEVTIKYGEKIVDHYDIDCGEIDFTIPVSRDCDWRPTEDYGQCEMAMGYYYDGETCKPVSGCGTSDLLPFSVDGYYECSITCQQDQETDIVLEVIDRDGYHIEDYPEVGEIYIAGYTNLTWNAISGADCYNVYQGIDSDDAYVTYSTCWDGTGDTHYDADGQVIGGIWNWQVVAVDTDGNEFSYSNKISYDFNVCYDSDGGHVYDKRGATRPGGRTDATEYDYCSDENTVVEWSCDYASVSSYSQECPIGCVNGACNKVN